MNQSKQGKQNAEQTSKQLAKQDLKNQVEFGEEYVRGNTKSQSQKKSGRQLNKK